MQRFTIGDYVRLTSTDAEVDRSETPVGSVGRIEEMDSYKKPKKIGVRFSIASLRWLDENRLEKVDLDSFGKEILKAGAELVIPDDSLHFINKSKNDSESEALLPSDAAARKNIPLASGVLDYFPSALVEIAKVSFKGNEQHNPGQSLHWSRGKSTDQSDTILRHFLERGKIDTDGVRHSAKMAWRALALLQLELEAEGAPMPRGAKK